MCRGLFEAIAVPKSKTICPIWQSIKAAAPLSFSHGGRGETLKEERLSYLRSLQRHAAMEYDEVRSVVAMKAGWAIAFAGFAVLVLWR